MFFIFETEKKEKMKRITVIFMFAIFLAACNQKSDEQKNNTDATATDSTQMVGNDMDENGCRGSAGYIWSDAKNRCIRIFEEGSRLDAVLSGMDTTVSAFVVFPTSPRDSIVEVFVPSASSGLLLQKKSEANWSNDSISLTESKGNFILQSKSGWKYQGASVK